MKGFSFRSLSSELVALTTKCGASGQATTPLSGKLILKISGRLNTLKFWLMDTGVVLQKIVVERDEIGEIYLSPPESFRLEGPSSEAHGLSSPCRVHFDIYMVFLNITLSIRYRITNTLSTPREIPWISKIPWLAWTGYSDLKYYCSVIQIRELTIT